MGGVVAWQMGGSAGVQVVVWVDGQLWVWTGGQVSGRQVGGRYDVESQVASVQLYCP